MPELDVPVPGEQIEVGPFGSPVVYRVVSRYASVAARDAAAPTPGNGEPCYVQDIDEFQIYDGSTWVKQSPSILTAGTAITVSGSSPDYTIAHGDTSTQAPVDNTGESLIQDIDLDTFGHITDIGSVAFWRSRWEKSEYAGGNNIGAGITTASVNFTAPDAGLVVMNWQATIERNDASQSSCQLTVIPRKDGVNIGANFRYTDVEISANLIANGDRIPLAGTASWVLGAGDTSTYAVFMSRVGMDVRADLVTFAINWYPVQG